MATSISPAASLAHPSAEVPGVDRLRGRTRDELFNALSWLAWYRLGIFTAVLDYLDYGNEQ